MAIQAEVKFKATQLASFSPEARIAVNGKGIQANETPANNGSSSFSRQRYGSYIMNAHQLVILLKSLMSEVDG